HRAPPAPAAEYEDFCAPLPDHPSSISEPLRQHVGYKQPDGAVLLVEEKHLTIGAGAEAHVRPGGWRLALCGVLLPDNFPQRFRRPAVLQQNPADGVLSAV